MAGGGVGEAMLLGAAMGGGSAAITGGDPLKGALLGGLTGGAGAGISGALGGAGTAAGTAAGSTAGSAAGTAAGTGAGITATAPTAALTSSSVPGMLGPIDYSIAAGAPGAGAGFTAASPVSAGITGLNPAAASQAITPTMATGPSLASNPMAYIKANPFTAGSAALAGAIGGQEQPEMPGEYDGPLKRFRISENYRPAAFAEGGIANLAAGGYDRMVGEEPMYQRMASGGISSLGSYSDGGRMLKGPGDGMSDSIPGVIGGRRPARLADGEFVVPADVVSHLGNGSTDAGAKQLYAMMDKVRKARTGRKAQGREIKPRKYMPA